MLRNLGTRMALQITLVIFLVVSVTDVITFVRVSRAVEETTARRFSETVARGAEHADNHVNEVSRLMLSGASLLATGPAFIDRFARGDSAALVQMAQAQRASINQAVPQDTTILLYDARGASMLGPGDGPAPGPILPNVERALTGTPVASMRRSRDLGIVFSGAAPVRTPEGRVLGVIEVVSNADDTFIKDLARVAAVEVDR